MILLLFIIPILTALSIWVTQNRKIINILNITGAFLLLAVSLYLTGEVMKNGVLTTGYLYNIFYFDSFSAVILFVTSVIGFLVALYSTGYINEEFRRNIVNINKTRVYFSLLHAFILTMLLTITTQNMGLMWISIEATTLASAFLVGFYNHKKSIEAAWKYIIICSVGIAFALLGIILLYYSSVQSMGKTVEGINWQFLYENAASLKGSILKISFMFILVGFGTKVGLAPMHTWLPDAHSQAPSPISALLSGVLLNTAMYGIARVMAIVNKSLNSNLFTGRLLLILGIISIGTAAVFILVQHDFKRTLAYSSIEHMGIIALGFGLLTPLSIFGALYHIINHAFTKSMLFIASGNVYLKYETKRINKVHGLIWSMPVTGIVFLMGIFAITGMPPFSVFSSELSIITASFGEGHYVIAALLLLFLVLIFAGFITRLLGMFYGKPQEKEVRQGELNYTGPAVLITLLAIITVTGLYLPVPLRTLLSAAGEIISGGVK